ncbi:HAD-IIA family hydrolase [Chloroflexales bacterium ZM16-3]|nr:HAD-IIA family hydrolase [Chloroflexales bacterium ZM16-3]
MSQIPAYEGYIFDLDGTVYLGDTLLPGAVALFARLRGDGRRVAFLSNNPTKNREQYVAKLMRFGIQASLSEVVNTTYVMVEWLKANAPGATVYPVSEQPLIDELTAAGFPISERAGEVQFVIASFDRTFVYHKLQVAFDAIRAGARLVATNPDRFCPVPGGGEPDAAAIIAAIEACANTRCEVNVGKPSPIMARTVSAALGLPPERCLMVGDRLMTDIAMGAEAGMDTALVLTGDSTRADLPAAPHQPTYILNDLTALL